MKPFAALSSALSSGVSSSAETLVDAAPDAKAACPRCSQPLVDPQGLGWCRACGYCKSLEEDRDKPVLQPTAAPEESRPRGAFAETGALVGGLPGWFWLTLVGVVVLAGTTAVLGRKLELTPLHRAVWATAQIAASLLMMLVGQMVGLIRIAPHDPTLTIRDALLPFRLYGLAFRFLPQTRLTLILGGWGLTLLLSAVFLVGGLGHWMNYLPGKTPPAATRPAR